MRKKLLLCAILFIGLLIGSLGTAVKFMEQNQMQQSLDCGVLTNRNNIEHVFSLRNYSFSGWSPTATKTSCGCTVVGSMTRKIKPLARLDVPVSVNLEAKNGFFESTVTVNFDDGQVAQFALRGQYYPELPASIELGKVKRGTKGKTYYWADGEASNVSVELQPNENLLELRTQGAKNGGLFVNVSVKADAAPGKFEQIASFSNSKNNGSPREVRISGQVALDVEAQSELVSFGYVDQDAPDPAIAVAQFFSPYETPFIFDPVSSSLPRGFQFESVPSEAVNRTSVSLKVDGHRLPLGLYRETAQFAFSIRGEKVFIPITLYGYVMKRPPLTESEEIVSVR